METTSVHPPIRPQSNISNQTVCRIFMKFGMAVPQNKVFSKHEFCENWRNESYILLKGINKI